MGIVVFGFVSVLVTFKDGSEEEHDIYSKDFVVVEGNHPERNENGIWKCAVLFKSFAKGYNAVAVVKHTAGEKTVCRCAA
jgi:ribosomal protein L37AE/L43A